MFFIWVFHWKLGYTQGTIVSIYYTTHSQPNPWNFWGGFFAVEACKAVALYFINRRALLRWSIAFANTVSFCILGSLTRWSNYAVCVYAEEEATNRQEGIEHGSGHPGLAEGHWRSVGSSVWRPWTSDGFWERGGRTIVGIPLMVLWGAGEGEGKKHQTQDSLKRVYSRKWCINFNSDAYTQPLYLTCLAVRRSYGAEKAPAPRTNSSCGRSAKRGSGWSESCADSREFWDCPHLSSSLVNRRVPPHQRAVSLSPNTTLRPPLWSHLYLIIIGLT